MADKRLLTGRGRRFTLIILTLLLSGCANGTTFRVLDAETREPIEGAVALAEWIGGRRMGVIAGPTYAYTAKVVEAVTDRNGIFKIPAVGGSLAMQTPHLKVYKLGYAGWDSRLIYLGCYEENRMVSRTTTREDFFMKDQDIYLEPWKDEYSFNSHDGFIDTNASFLKVGKKDSKYLKAIHSEIPFRVREDSLKNKRK